MSYDYREGAKRIKEILDSTPKIIAQDSLPSEDKFTFENSYETWVTAVFVDIRDSTSLFHNKNKVEVAKIVRSFTSEVIEILRYPDTLEEIGIRGDCVYAIYNTPYQTNIYAIQDLTVQINTLMKMLNKLLSRKGLQNIEVGIGMASAKELIIKAGRKNSGINSRVWIGDAVTTASKLSSLAGRGLNSATLFNKTAYDSFYDLLVKEYGKDKVDSWFTYVNRDMEYYMASLIIIGFDEFVNNEL